MSASIEDVTRPVREADDDSKPLLLRGMPPWLRAELTEDSKAFGRNMTTEILWLLEGALIPEVKAVLEQAMVRRRTDNGSAGER